MVLTGKNTNVEIRIRLVLIKLIVGVVKHVTIDGPVDYRGSNRFL
jgi:hypothetical protein